MSLEAVLVACVATVGVDAGLASAPHRVDKRRKEGLGDLLPLSCKSSPQVSNRVEGRPAGDAPPQLVPGMLDGCHVGAEGRPGKHGNVVCLK